MMLTSDKVGVRSALPRSGTRFLPGAGHRARGVSTNASKQSECQDTTKRNLLAAVGILGSFTVIQSVQAATDPYEELRSITASRGGSTSLLESFSGTRDAVAAAAAKADRGIRERLAAEATNAPKPSSAAQPSSSSSGGGGGFRFFTPATRAKPSTPVAAAAAPKASSGSGFSLFGSSSGPKPQAPKPQAPKPAAPQAAAAAPRAAAAAASKVAATAPKAAAAAAAAEGSGGGVLGPAIQAVGVLGLVGVGANALTSFATSNKKGGAKSTSAAAAAAPTGTKRVQSTQSGTARISANKPTATSGSATRKVAAGAGAAASRTERIVKKAPVAAAAATGTVKGFIKEALVNSEQPDEPTDFAVAGILGITAAVGAFFIFGLPQATFTEPVPSSRANDPLVELAKEGGFGAASRSTYKNPLFKSLRAE